MLDAKEFFRGFSPGKSTLAFSVNKQRKIKNGLMAAFFGVSIFDRLNIGRNIF